VVSIPARTVAISGSLDRSMGRGWDRRMFAVSSLAVSCRIVAASVSCQRTPLNGSVDRRCYRKGLAGCHQHVASHEQRVRRGACSLGQLAERQIASLGSPRHPLQDRAFCPDEDDQGDLVAGHPNGADGASLSSNASARVAMTVSGSLPSSCCHC
jgi:hypothetical protein